MDVILLGGLLVWEFCIYKRGARHLINNSRSLDILLNPANMKGVSLTALVLTLTLASIGFSTPLTKRQVPCTAPIARKEW